MPAYEYFVVLVKRALVAIDGEHVFGHHGVIRVLAGLAEDGIGADTSSMTLVLEVFFLRNCFWDERFLPSSLPRWL